MTATIPSPLHPQFAGLAESIAQMCELSKFAVRPLHPPGTRGRCFPSGSCSSEVIAAHTGSVPSLILYKIHVVVDLLELVLQLPYAVLGAVDKVSRNPIIPIDHMAGRLL